MRICFLGNEERRQYLQGVASPGTVVERLADFTPKSSRPVTIESMYEEYMLIPWVLEMTVEAARRGYDAVVTGCFADPGVDAARELVDIPVIGPGQAAMHTAAMLGHTFSILTIFDSTVKTTRNQVRQNGLLDKLASVRAVNVPVLKIREAADETYRIVRDTALRCLEEDQADVLVIGCASMSYAFADRLQADLGVPVVNSLKNSLKVAEMLAGGGLSHSKRAYPVPPKMAAGQSAGVELP
ncbi:MAG: aspartate/glutamate racemase family protein [Limnochordales bacterium]|nr:aspartate/glutamate racemase family protein [Limnochordales bacterium]